jgi:hypothetical protein
MSSFFDQINLLRIRNLNINIGNLGVILILEANSCDVHP